MQVYIKVIASSKYYNYHDHHDADIYIMHHIKINKQTNVIKNPLRWVIYKNIASITLSDNR